MMFQWYLTPKVTTKAIPRAARVMGRNAKAMDRTAMLRRATPGVGLQSKSYKLRARVKVRARVRAQG